MVLNPTLFLLYISDLPDDVFISNIAIYVDVDDTTVFSKSDKASVFLATTRVGF